MKPVICAMVGTIGSGKSTFAKRLALEKRAVLFSIDKMIKQLKQPIETREDFDRYYLGVRDVIADLAIQNLKLEIAVVLDFGGSVGHWEWLKALAAAAKADVEIYHLVAPIEVRRERVRSRNQDPEAVFHFTDEEFNSMPTESATPPEESGLKVILIKDSDKADP